MSIGLREWAPLVTISGVRHTAFPFGSFGGRLKALGDSIVSHDNLGRSEQNTGRALDGETRLQNEPAA